MEKPKAYNGDGSYIFVSYSHGDQDIVENDIVWLQQKGCKIWYDEAFVAGDNWRNQAYRKIKSNLCVGVIFYLSKCSIISKAISEELEDAERFNKRFFSVNIGGNTADKILDDLGHLSELDDNISCIISRRFPESKIFIPRSNDPHDISHLEKLLKDINHWNVIESNEISALSNNKNDQQVVVSAENTANNNDLSHDENTYLNALRTVCDDGVITPEERTILTFMVGQLKLTQERAAELEDLVMNESVKIQSPETEPFNAEIAAKVHEENCPITCDQNQAVTIWNLKELADVFITNELNVKYSDYMNKYGCRFEAKMNGPRLWIELGIPKLYFGIYFGIGENDFNFCFDDWGGTSKDLLVRWTELHLAKYFPGWSPNKRRTYEFVTLLKRIFEKGVLEKTAEEKFSEFKLLTLKSLDIILPTLAHLVDVVDEFNKYIGKLTEVFKSIFYEDCWVVDVAEKLLPRYAGIGIYKKTWKSDDKKWGLRFLVAAESGSAFQGCLIGVAKFDYTYENDRLSEIQTALNEKLGTGNVSSWWPYHRFADNCYAWPGPINVQQLSVISEEKQLEYVEYYRGVFSKLKEVAPLVDDILGVG